MSTNPTPTPLASTVMAAAREINDIVAKYSEQCDDLNSVAAIIQKHFQPLLAKVEGERDALDRAVTLNRNNWRIDSEEKDAVITALRADLAAATKALDDQTKGVWSEWWLNRAKIIGELESLELFTVPQLKADLAAKEASLERYMQRISSHDEGPCDHACGVCVKNAGADDSMVIPNHLCTYHEVCAALASRADKGGAT